MGKELSLFIVLDDYYHQSRDFLEEQDYQSLKHVFQNAYPAILKDKTGEYSAIAEALAIVLSQFIVELLGSDEDLEDYRDCFANEVGIYESFLRHEKTINEYVNLSIALSHASLYHYKMAEYELSISFEKKRLNNLQIALEKSYAGDKSYRYDLNSIESDVYYSACALLSSSECMAMDIRTEIFEVCFENLSKVIEHNKNTAINIYSLTNSLAEALFKELKETNLISATHYILCKICNLESLYEIYGTEEAIIEDMQHTYQLCSDFVEANPQTIDNNNQLVWQQLVDILSNHKII